MEDDISAVSALSVAARLPAARLLGMVLAGFVAGTVFQLQQATLFAVSAYGGLLAASLMLFGLLASWRTGWRQAFALALLASAALGFGLTGIRATLFQLNALQSELEGKDVLVTGQVVAMPQFADEGVRFRFEVSSASAHGQLVRLPQQILLGWYSGFGARINKTLPPLAPAVAADFPSGEPPEFSIEQQRQPQTLRAGERWQMTVRLKAPHGNSNPYGFDYELWLWEQGLQATGYVRSGPKDTPPQKLASSWAHPVERARQSVREAIFERIDDRKLAGVLAALVVGDQNAIERADWEVFRTTGVAHLMSISGLHITMFAWVASLVISGLWRRSARLTPALCLGLPASAAGAWGGLLLAALYALFSGWGVPAQRTIWMLVTVVLLRQSGKQWPWPLVWLLAMAVVVLLDPWALMQAGFWLSFVAVGVLFAAGHSPGESAVLRAKSQRQSSDSGSTFSAIEAGASYRQCWRTTGLNSLKTWCGRQNWTGWLLRPLAGLATAAREQWIVTLALTPLSLLLFNQVSLVGLLANALAIPWVTLVVTPLAMMGVFWSGAWDIAARAVSLLVYFLQWLAAWPVASVNMAAAPVWCGIAGVVGGVLLAVRLPLHWRALGIPLMLPVLLWQPQRPVSGQFEILGADIGQGNALVVRTAGHSLIYDTGPKFSGESDAGSRVLVPLLRALGERVDVLMLSHRDLDHIGGAVAVLAMQPQAQLISSIEDSHELQAMRRSTRCVAGQHWRWDGVAFEVLHPPLADYSARVKSNAMSCVLRISNGRQTALLAGDLEAPQELRLVNDPAVNNKLAANFLLMPHHGSKTSSSAVFLDAVKPQFALAQAGYRNRFGHPVAAVLARYEERGIQVVKSPVCGAASWQSAQPESVLCQREAGARYWHHRLEPPS